MPVICVSRPQACVTTVMEANSTWWHTVSLLFCLPFWFSNFLNLCPNVGVGIHSSSFLLLGSGWAEMGDFGLYVLNYNSCVFVTK